MRAIAALVSYAPISAVAGVLSGLNFLGFIFLTMALLPFWIVGMTIAIDFALDTRQARGDASLRAMPAAERTPSDAT